MENNIQPTEHKKSGSGMIITIVIVVLIVIFALTSSGNSKKDQAMKDAAMMEQQAMQEQNLSDEAMMQKGEDTSMMKKDDNVMVQGSYAEYAPEKLAMAASGPVVLFFKADWCPSCKAVDKDINANLSAIPAGTNILKVDYDNSKDLKKKYGVTYQHTFVQVDAQGNMIKKWSGSPTLSALVSQIKL